MCVYIDVVEGVDNTYKPKARGKKSGRRRGRVLSEDVDLT